MASMFVVVANYVPLPFTQQDPLDGFSSTMSILFYRNSGVSYGQTSVTVVSTPSGAIVYSRTWFMSFAGSKFV